MKKALAVLGTLLMLALSGSAVEPPALEWDYEDAPTIHFEIWASTDLEHWAYIGSTYAHWFHIEPPPRETFYRCRAVDSNDISSDWSNTTGYGFTQLQTEALNQLIDAAQ